jgi:hypothetical protein
MLRNLYGRKFFADAPRADRFEAPIHGDEGWHRNAKPKP